MCLLQRWSGPDRRVHHPQYRAGEDEVRGRGGHLPDRQDAAHPEARHRPDRGEFKLRLKLRLLKLKLLKLKLLKLKLLKLLLLL